MIFVTLGSQKFQFNRLLKKIDELIADKIISEEVYAQIGYSDYQPLNYKFKHFYNRDEYSEMTEKCQLFITHGGTGAIVGAVKRGKKVIAVPRLERYGEHVDDHQMQLLKQFDGMGIISVCYDLCNLEQYYLAISDKELQTYVSNTEKILTSIDTFLNLNGDK